MSEPTPAESGATTASLCLELWTIPGEPCTYVYNVDPEACECLSSFRAAGKLGRVPAASCQQGSLHPLCTCQPAGRATEIAPMSLHPCRKPRGDAKAATRGVCQAPRHHCCQPNYAHSLTSGSCRCCPESGASAACQGARLPCHSAPITRETGAAEVP